ncbi:MAG: nicotinate-nucleotide diphosphorylase (carboxylating) [Spirochaetaceae bacterium 4572_7]|nr:MAG: nicotinate-nucleotide diphosphorylase (carboxylating) [Spirochaetaceae bacterium 4572_7]
MKLYQIQYKKIIEDALLEDFSRGGDLTTSALIPKDAKGDTVLRARETGIIAGLEAALYAFTVLDNSVKFKYYKRDGDKVSNGDKIVKISGNIQAMLSAERTCLNLLGRLSGIASFTKTLVDEIGGTGAEVADTRKTTPGLRVLEKYAVKIGGGINHRFGLDDAVMIKDNHLAFSKNLTDAVRKVRSYVGHTVKIEVEVDTIKQLEELLKNPVDIVLLDNMTPEKLKEAVLLIDGKMITEASGNISIETIRSVAESGVDIISSGALTHSVKNFDIGLDYS